MSALVSPAGCGRQVSDRHMSYRHQRHVPRLQVSHHLSIAIHGALTEIQQWRRACALREAEAASHERTTDPLLSLQGDRISGLTSPPESAQK